MISLSFLNLLGVDIIQLFWVCFQRASSVRGSPTSLLGEAESCTPTRREPRGSTDRRERGRERRRRRKKRSEPRTRLTRALAPYSPDRAAVGDAEGSPGLGAGEARRAGKLQQASGGGRLPAHPTRSPSTSSTTAGRTRESRRRSAPLLATRTGRAGQGQPGRAGAATLPSCSSRRLRRSGVPPGLGMLLPLLRRHTRLLLPQAGKRNRDPKASPGRRPQGRLPHRKNASWAQPRRSLGLRRRRLAGPLPPGPPCAEAASFSPDPLSAAAPRRPPATDTLAHAPGGAAPPEAAKLPARSRPAAPRHLGSELRAAAAGAAARGSARRGRARGRGRLGSAFPSPPSPPPGAVRKRRARPGRWTPLVANHSPALRVEPGGRGQRPQLLPELRSPSSWETPPDPAVCLWPRVSAVVGLFSVYSGEIQTLDVSMEEKDVTPRCHSTAQKEHWRLNCERLGC